MDSYTTPLKQKRNQFRNQIRTQMLDSMRKEIRNGMLKTQTKKQQGKVFSKICNKFNQSLFDEENLNQLKNMFYKEDFIITQPKCLQLLPSIQKWHQFSQKDCNYEQQTSKINDNQQFGLSETILHPNKNQTAQTFLLQIIKILILNAQIYPQYGTFNDESIISTVFDILKSSKVTKILKGILKLLHALVLGQNTRSYMIQKGILQLLSQESIRNQESLTKYIQFLLHNLFSHQPIRVTSSQINDLNALLLSHYNMLQSQKSIGQMYYLVQDLFACIDNQQAKSMDLSNLCITFLSRSQVFEYETLESRLYFTSMLVCIYKKLQLMNQLPAVLKIKCLNNFKKVWIMHLEIQISCQNACFKEQHNKNARLSEQTKIVQSFGCIFDFIISKLHNQQLVISYCQYFFRQIYPNLKVNPIPYIGHTSLLKIAIKWYRGFKPTDCLTIKYWYQQLIRDVQGRICCLKYLIKWKRQGYLSNQDYFDLYKLYKRYLVQEEKDLMSEYLLTTFPLPSQQDIEINQKRIKNGEFFHYQLDQISQEIGNNQHDFDSDFQNNKENN